MESCARLRTAAGKRCLNQLGIKGQGLIADIDFNNPVNNHPIIGHEIEYFDVKNGKKGDLKSSLREVTSYKDKRKEFRHPSAKYIVGVEMKMIFSHWRNLKKSY